MPATKASKRDRKTRALTARAEVERLLLTACWALKAAGQNFAKYADNPVAFCREVLKFEPWSRQADVMTALVDHDAVCCPAGRAVGKSRLAAGIALWFALTVPGGRVILTAPSFKQVQNILWEEIRLLARECGHTLPIEIAKTAATGARTAEGSQLLGVTAAQPENFQGIRAARMLVIADEASGIPDEIFHVIDGNTAGGAKLLLTGNPTKSKGYFRDAAKSPHTRFHVIRISSEESPNVLSGEYTVRGLATRDWIEERKREWGADSPLYKIHVLGEFVEGQEGCLFPAEMIAGASAQWADQPAVGRLFIGVDPAGESGKGDESGFACRRGRKVLFIQGRRGMNEQAHLTHILGLIALHRGDSTEVPAVVLDSDGHVGAKVYAVLSAYVLVNPGVFQLIRVRGGERAKRKPFTYDRVRDEVWFGLADAFRDGLTIPEDVMMAAELAEIKAESHISGRSKVTDKDDLRKALNGRSPDRADALSLACFQVTDWTAANAQNAAPPPRPEQDPYRDPRARGIDPYASLDPWA